jgi:glycosyltransferase involved in cell wall biosynthesis
MPGAMKVALHVLVFFPRGGSAQVVRYLASWLGRATRWRGRVVAGSLGEPGEPGHAPSFFSGVDDLHVVAYDEALRSADPLLASPPLHPSYEDRPGAPDRVFAALDDATYEHLVAEWERVLLRPGVLDGASVAHLHHLTPAHEALRRVAPDLPVITHLHGTELLMLDHIAAGARWPHAAAWAERLRRWANRSARLVASSASSARDAVDALGVPAERIAVVPNGVDPEIFDGRRGTPAERASLWRRLLVEEPHGWTAEDPRPGTLRYTDADLAPLRHPRAVTVAFVGRFTAVKRIPVLLRAHERARAQLSDPLPLVVLGGAPGEWEGEHPADLARRSAAAAEVFLAGWWGHRETAQALGCSDLLAVPSARERFGQVYVEAMAMGVPPIAVGRGAPAEIIDADPTSPHRTGWLVPPDDDVALAAALVAAASDAGERALRAANGRDLVARGYTWPAIARRVADLYDEVAAAGPRRGARDAAPA